MKKFKVSRMNNSGRVDMSGSYSLGRIDDTLAGDDLSQQDISLGKIDSSVEPFDENYEDDTNVDENITEETPVENHSVYNDDNGNTIGVYRKINIFRGRNTLPHVTTNKTLTIDTETINDIKRMKDEIKEDVIRQALIGGMTVQEASNVLKNLDKNARDLISLI